MKLPAVNNQSKRFLICHPSMCLTSLRFIKVLIQHRLCQTWSLRCQAEARNEKPSLRMMHTAQPPPPSQMLYQLHPNELR
jgi:hypothetical protein